MKVTHLHWSAATSAGVCLRCTLIMTLLWGDALKQLRSSRNGIGSLDEISLFTVLRKQVDHLTHNPVI